MGEILKQFGENLSRQDREDLEDVINKMTPEMKNYLDIKNQLAEVRKDLERTIKEKEELRKAGNLSIDEEAMLDNYMKTLRINIDELVDKAKKSASIIEPSISDSRFDELAFEDSRQGKNKLN